MWYLVTAISLISAQLLWGVDVNILRYMAGALCFTIFMFSIRKTKIIQWIMGE